MSRSRLLMVFACAMAAVSTWAFPCYGNPPERRAPPSRRYASYNYPPQRQHRVAQYSPYTKFDQPAPRYAGQTPHGYGYGDTRLQMDYAAPRRRQRVPPYPWGWFGVVPQPQSIYRTRWDGKTDWQVRYGD